MLIMTVTSRPQYINSIREEAERAGVIKIIPPKEWLCPFSAWPPVRPDFSHSFLSPSASTALKIAPVTAHVAFQYCPAVSYSASFKPFQNRVQFPALIWLCLMWGGPPRQIKSGVNRVLFQVQRNIQLNLTFSAPLLHASDQRPRRRIPFSNGTFSTLPHVRTLPCACNSNKPQHLRDFPHNCNAHLCSVAFIVTHAD